MATVLRPALVGASTFVITLAAACGGNVTVDRVRGSSSTTTTATGAGGGSTTTTTGTTTSTTNPTTTTTTNTTTVPPDLCSEVCTVLVQSGCEQGGQGQCVAQCNDSLVQAGSCASALAAVYECYRPFLAQCPKDPPAQCSDTLQAYTQCVNQGGGCGSANCSQGGGPGGESCDCQQSCNGRFTEASCTTTQGTTVCSCVIDGGQVGTCSGSPSKDACSLTQGCCAAFF